MSVLGRGELLVVSFVRHEVQGSVDVILDTLICHMVVHSVSPPLRSQWSTVFGPIDEEICWALHTQAYLSEINTAVIESVDSSGTIYTYLDHTSDIEGHHP